MAEDPGSTGTVAGRYGLQWADVYDSWIDALGDPERDAAVELLAYLADGGRVLELGGGTGRLALPLAARGVEVWTIEMSEAMVERLRAKPGGDTVHVITGDFSEVAAPGEFSLIYASLNTFFQLPSVEDQLRCFHNVATRLAANGAFVIEGAARWPQEDRLAVSHVGDDGVILQATRVDPGRQHLHAQHIFLDSRGVRMLPTTIRYAWPSELDLMARLAGLTLAERWGGWEREPFTSASTLHISLYSACQGS